MAKRILVGSLEFPTKKSAKEFFRKIRDAYTDGIQVSEQHQAFLSDLVAIHPEATTKIGVGISHFTVATERQFGRTRHFVIHRIDGSSTDVSFHSAIDGRNERRDRMEALRRGIEDQIVAFKDNAFSYGENPICPLRGVVITEDSYHVDHAPPQTFMRLAEAWLEVERIQLADVHITPPADNQIVTEMTEPSQLISWQQFHQNHAKLRLLSPLGNLSDSKRSC